MPDYQELNRRATEAGFRIKLIVFVREQVSYLESRYIQHVKRRGNICTPEEDIREGHGNIAHLKYGSFLRGLADVVGKENISIFAFEPDQLFDNVAGALGLDITGLEIPEGQINSSLPLALVPIFLELNRLKPSASFTDAVVRDHTKLSSHLDMEPQTIVPPALRQEIVDSYAEENAMLADDWFGGTLPFTASPPPYVSLEALKEALDLDVMTRLFGGVAIEQEKRLRHVEQMMLQLGHSLNSLQAARKTANTVEDDDTSS